jgi:CDP-glycerol glycerophosphotransferase (TagB/SpsB family)
MEESMRPTEKVLTTGLPRNDRLWAVPADLWPRLGAPAAAKCERIVVWLPTYRHSVVGKRRNDGHETGSVFGIEGIGVDDFNEFLRQRNAFGIVKPHPMARFEGRKDLSHLRVINDEQLRDCGVSLYEVLGASDVLITDISSVYIDYLLLDRPIIHSFADMAQYDASRGFSVSPVEDYFAGPLVTDAEELLGKLGSILAGEDEDADKRRALGALFHRHHDAGAARRLLEELGLSSS